MCRCCKVPSVKPLHHLLIPVWVRLFIPGVWAETAAVSESLWWDLLQASAEKSHSTCNLTQRTVWTVEDSMRRPPLTGPHEPQPANRIQVELRWGSGRADQHLRGRFQRVQARHAASTLHFLRPHSARKAQRATHYFKCLTFWIVLSDLHNVSVEVRRKLNENARRGQRGLTKEISGRDQWSTWAATRYCYKKHVLMLMAITDLQCDNDVK